MHCCICPKAQVQATLPLLYKTPPTTGGSVTPSYQGAANPTAGCKGAGWSRDLCEQGSHRGHGSIQPSPLFTCVAFSTAALSCFWMWSWLYVSTRSFVSAINQNFPRFAIFLHLKFGFTPLNRCQIRLRSGFSTRV